MGKRAVLAGVLGAVAMFVWTSIAHLATPLATTGFQEIPNEKSVTAPLQAAVGQNSGMFIFPGFGLGHWPSRAEMNEAMKHEDERLAANPSGILIYHPPGMKQLAPGQLITEFATELLEALLVVFLLAQTNIRSFGGRVGFVMVAGILAAIATNISYWNWYGFPGNYTAAYMFIQVVGFLCVGIIAGLVMRNAVPRSQRMTA